MFTITANLKITKREVAIAQMQLLIEMARRNLKCGFSAWLGSKKLTANKAPTTPIANTRSSHCKTGSNPETKSTAAL
ncbi:unannotated protein [freshwater metagenome]|uniref:Unannotated protein n=1 Tax=freshwater metagenome TaxID=449393 RepID=A0A6J7UD57_9ZZZZ